MRATAAARASVRPNSFTPGLLTPSQRVFDSPQIGDTPKFATEPGKCQAAPFSALSREIHGLLGDEPDVDWLFFGNEAGGGVSVGRLAHGTRVSLMTDGFRAGVVRQYEASLDGQMRTLRKSGAEFDTRQKLWYIRAKDTHERYWTEPYLGSSEPILGISLSAPVFDKDGTFAGVCGIDLSLTRLSNFMQSPPRRHWARLYYRRHRATDCLFRRGDAGCDRRRWPGSAPARIRGR